MTPSPSAFSDALTHQCTQELYRCVEEVGSTKGALYLRVPRGQEGEGTFALVCEYGWPRGSHAPEYLLPQDPLLVWVQREKRPFAVNEAKEFSELDAFSEGSETPRFILAPVYLKGAWVGLLVQRDRIKGAPFDMDRDEKPTRRICNDFVDILTGLKMYSEVEPAPKPSPKLNPGSSTMPMPLVVPSLVPSGPRSTSGPIPEKAALGKTQAMPLVAISSQKIGPSSKENYSQLPWDPDTFSGVSAQPSPARFPAMPFAPRSEEVEESTVDGKRRGMALPEQRAFFWEAARLLSQLVPLDAVALWMEESEELRPILAYSDRPLSSDLQQQLLAQATFHLSALKEEDLRILTRPEKREVMPLVGVFTTYFPLWLGDEEQSVQGVRDLLLLFRLQDSPFTPAERALMGQVGHLLHLHLEEGRLHERYHRAFLSVSHRILKSGEGRAPKMREHSLTCAKLSRSVALRLELPTADVEAISIAAILHDVGSLLLDPQMMKKSELSAAELAKARTHPMLAATFLKDLHFPFDVLRIIRHHHERWDGKGYPDGLAGEAIPIGSRIIGLVETFDVMTTGKGYKAPKALAKALAEIQNEAGSQFDPRAVEALMALVGKGK